MLSVDDVMAAKPCWSRWRVEAVFDGRERLGLDDLLKLNIHIMDKVWVLCKFSKWHQDKLIEEANKLLATELQILTSLQDDLHREIHQVIAKCISEWLTDWICNDRYVSVDWRVSFIKNLANGQYYNVVTTLAHYHNPGNPFEWMRSFIGVSDVDS